MIKLFKFREALGENGTLVERVTDLQVPAESVVDLFNNIEEIMARIPKEEHYNLHFTLCNCKKDVGRVFDFQEVIPFDFDGIDTDRIEEYIEIFLKVTKVRREDITIVNSGNGLHFYIFLDYLIDEIAYFNDNRVYYKTICGMIDYEIRQAKLVGSADVLVFAPSRTLRLPRTINRKRGKAEKLCDFINKGTTPLQWSMQGCVKIEEVTASDQVAEKALRHVSIDTTAVLSGCKYLKWCKSNPDNVNEAQWYAMLSVLGRLQDGVALAHSYSNAHHNYSEDETENKLEYAMAASGPRTCKNIATLWSGCNDCPHNGKIASPVMIKPEGFIKSEAAGFWFTKLDKQGMPVADKPDYEGLIQKFSQDNKYVTVSSSRLVYIYIGTHWKELDYAYIEGYCYEKMNPRPNGSIRHEFLDRIKCTNLVDSEFFELPTGINFANGWLDLDSLQLHEHTSDKGFLYVLPYEYDPSAACPRFDTFMQEITLGDKELEQVLMEFAGYCISDMPPSVHDKCLLLYGDGANGKSVFLDVLKEIAGKDNYTAITMKDIENPTNRYMMMGKLFNVAEETPLTSLADSSTFKTLVSGGDIIAKKLYSQPFSMRSSAKLLFACNTLPPSTDNTLGLYRRMLVVPFNATFSEKNRDRNLRATLYAEAQGIINRIVDGYKSLKERGRFPDSAAIDREIEGYIAENDTVKEFADTFLEDLIVSPRDTNAPYEFLHDMYELYKDEVESAGKKPLPLSLFSRRLKRLYPKSESVRKVDPASGKRLTAMMGIQLLTRSSF